MNERAETAPATSRRHFLDLLLGASFLGWLVGIAYPIIRYLKPLPQTGPTGPTHLTRDEASKLEQNKFVIVPVSGQRVIVLQAGDQLHAFSAKCTHEGCTVTFLPGQSVIWCPCHDGRLISAAAYCPGRRRSRCLHISSNANPTVESSFHEEGPDVKGSGKSRGLRGWLDRRYQLTPLVEFLRHKEVPLGSHWMGWYYLGGITMFFFVVQVVTGVLLLMYYQPGEATAYESIRFLTTKVPFGWLIRSIHSWSAHLMIISLTLHMFSTMMLKAYRPPREMTWVSGYLLFLLTLGFGFSGYLLPWNKLAYFATTVGTNIVQSVPLLGNWLLQVLRGGQDVTINTLYRFFAAHVVILPLAFVGIIGLHLLLIQRQGMAPPVGAKTAPRGMKFFPSFALRDALLWLACLMALVTLAVFLPYGPGIPGMDWELGEKADPLAPAYPGIKPEWYFLWEYQLLEGISAAPLWSGRPAGLFVVDRDCCLAFGRSFPGSIGALITTNHRRHSAISVGRRFFF